MENKHYRLGRYFVDVSRNEIVHGDSTVSVPPKAMEVLHVLIQNQGKVIAFSTLTELVWHNRVVSPNSLQRCISQLRQAFGEDSKSQSVIRTHARRGYSLELPVGDDFASVPKRRYLAHVLIFGGLILAGLSIEGWRANQTNLAKIEITASTPLTSSDGAEMYGSFSADGRFIVFLRSIDACHSHIWVKDVTRAQTFRLSSEPGVYGRPRWSLDGTYIVVSARGQCQSGSEAQQRWSIKRFNMVANQPLPHGGDTILDSSHLRIGKVLGLKQGAVAFLQEYSDNQVRLATYSSQVGKVVPLFSPAGMLIYEYAYLPKRDQFVVLGMDSNNQHDMVLLSSSGEKLAQHRLQFSPAVSAVQGEEVSIHPSERFLIAEIAGKLYHLTLKGGLSVLPTPTRHKVSAPHFHPDGQSLLVTESYADTDIRMFSFKTNSVDEPALYPQLRSNLSDEAARFQPDGELVAFTSTRSGKRQVWLSNGQTSYPLEVPDAPITSRFISWSPSGSALAAATQDGVIVYDLEGGARHIKTRYPVLEVLQWSDKQTLLVLVPELGSQRLYQLHLQNSRFMKVSDRDLLWAVSTPNTEVVVLDKAYRVWIGDKEVSRLANKLERPYFSLYERDLYGVSPDRKLWRYNLDDDVLHYIAQLPVRARYVSDVNGEQALLTYMMQLNRELVSFSVQ
ncbi:MULTISPECIES: winged helix-turn-helix domain-containing protein [unclassified Pseudoalteromonas]|uniref:winged helix-turn-helix domain-containing protein n=1 Tax=unclassified Pseudoalteromonas TaxID=194690 RepID=UPI002096CEDC|nr:winged helix-turn-helix domain-containing protein [Pseudoalteromonas sp. XMcav2-N]MCO7187532.1 winged helix-turn-helix domain-containing protein [Pseudoalteromonas sp. XMcav2-N]